MPCPLIFGEPYFAMNPTMIPPMTGMTIIHGPSWLFAGLRKWKDHSW